MAGIKTKEAWQLSQQEPKLKCLACSSNLILKTDAAACQNCNSSWPIEGGIPRFFKNAKYWGELTPSDAELFVQEARELGWRNAVERRFGANNDMLVTFFDWQRASWIPLLGLKGNSVVLDVGSGYGAITHALAKAAGEVYSVEAVSQRIDFNKVRLEQEEISNVHLIQASALQLPLCERLFDSIVLNGILEWVGEWASGDDPRRVQVDFLASLHRLLKEDGILLIGVENRIGYAAFRGAIDHSGLRYTSIMPRFLASLCLRLSKKSHDRTTINPKREYRTYTYSRNGYQKLLADSGFASSEFYWTNPSYNQPYYVIPLGNSLVREKFRTYLRYAPNLSPKFWRRRIKSALGRVGVPEALVSEFLILAGKRETSVASARKSILNAFKSTTPAVPDLENPMFEIATHPFGEKCVLRVYEARENVPRFVIKASTPVAGSQDKLESEFRNLKLVADLRELSRPNFFVSKPIGSARLGSCFYTVETLVEGQEVSQLLPVHVAPKLASVTPFVERCVNIALEIAQLLKGQSTVQAIDKQFLMIPEALTLNAQVRKVWQEIGSERSENRSSYRHYVQHGDFTVFNIFADPERDRFSVVDWGGMIRSVPPLYDTFSFLISILPSVRTDKIDMSAARDIREYQFLTAFFGRGDWGSFVSQLLTTASERLQISRQEVWVMFVQFLVIRSHFCSLWRSRELGYILRFLELASVHNNEFVLAP